MTRNQRINFALLDSGLGQTGLSKELGIAQSSISKRLNSSKQVTDINFITSVSKLTGYSVSWLLDGKGIEKGGGTVVYPDIDPEEQRNVLNDIDTEKYLTGKLVRPIVVTVDRSGKELMPFVTVKAQAGYPRGYSDVRFIEKLPAFSLPILREGTYRMFEVDGESMLQIGGGGLHDGDIVISQYLEDIFTMRDNRVYVIVCPDGVIVKRCLNRLREKENPVLVCNSDNKNGQHAAIILRPHEILEVWELKAFISKQLSFSTDLWETLNNLQVQQALMEEKLKDMQTIKLK